MATAGEDKVNETSIFFTFILSISIRFTFWLAVLIWKESMYVKVHSNESTLSDVYLTLNFEIDAQFEQN